MADVAARGHRRPRVAAGRPAAPRCRIAPGTLTLDWRVGEPRVIAQVRLPRLHVSFRFEGLDAGQRLAFMKRFDLYMQRGGG